MVASAPVKVVIGLVLGAVALVLAVIISFRFPQIKTLMASSSNNSPNHVIVVGGGLAGLCATIEATRHGATVTIIEKEKSLGGNSAKATSGINGVNTEAQWKHDIKDSPSAFVKDTLSSGDGLSNPQMVQVLADHSADAIEFLRTFNLNLMDVVQLGGHSAKRTHRFPPTAEGKAVPVGFTIMSTLKKYIASDDISDQVTVLTNSVFKEIVPRDGKSVAVKYTDKDGKDQELDGVVVLTAGGYANDHTGNSLLERHVPDLAKYPTTNGPWATGDVIKALEYTGISTVHMDKVQVHPTGFVDPKDPKFHTKFLGPEALRGCGAILLDGSGKRFVNELGRRDHVTAEITQKCGRYGDEADGPITATMLLSQEVIDKFSAPLAGFYVFKGLIQNVKTLSAVAETIKVPEETLKQTIKDYNLAASKGSDEFGKTAFPTTFTEDSNFYLAFVTPTLHYCMGGIEINENAQVLTDISGGHGQKTLKPVPGLYGAGEVTGGVHGNNRLGGNSLLECVVFGRIAGYHAAHFKS